MELSGQKTVIAGHKLGQAESRGSARMETGRRTRAGRGRGREAFLPEVPEEL